MSAAPKGRRSSDGDDDRPERPADAVGWGDDVREAENDPDDVRRFLDEVPPHHGD